MKSKTEQAIQPLYQVFRNYRFTDMEGDPLFPGFCDPAPLLAEPLAELPPQAFENFAWKAVTTWGTASDLRHFLPRMLELAYLNSDTPPLETWQLYGKIDYADWRSWPKAEQAAIECYIDARWFDVIYQETNLTEESGIIQPYLRPWGAGGPSTPGGYLAAVVRLDPSLMSRLLSDWSDWIEDATEMSPVLSLAEVYLLLDGIWDARPEGLYVAWLKDKKRVQQLASAWDKHQDTPLVSAYLSDAHSAAERWLARIG